MKDIKPIIKWAGGKRQLLDTILPMIPKFHIYYEPFFGGGAVFFALQPEMAVVNDLNKGLVNLYRQLQCHLDEIMKELDRLQNEYNQLPDLEAKKEYYYQKRDIFNHGLHKEENTIELAALFVFINKACFNGIYRENSKGLFNVPSGRKEKVNCYDEENLRKVGKQLEETIVLSNDFRKICTFPEKGDFVFFDPPYYDTFSDYQKNGFSEEDQRELAKLFADLTKRGVKCMLTNSNTDFIKDLYKDYFIKVVSVKRMINRNGDDRTGEEVIITNYDPEKIS